MILMLFYQKPHRYNKSHKGPITQVGYWVYNSCGNAYNASIDYWKGGLLVGQKSI